MESYRIVLSYACYAIEVEGGIIKDSAPIAKWAIGKSLEWFKGWVAKKGGRIHKLEGGNHV